MSREEKLDILRRVDKVAREADKRVTGSDCLASVVSMN